MAQEFILLRIGNLRGVDLSIFEVDYDLSWNALFLTAEGQVLGRFGGRDADTPGKYQTLAGLRLSLEENLQRFKSPERKKSPPRMPTYAENYPAADKRADNACIHCHHVYEFRREEMKRTNQWTLDEVWVYPQPENIGLTLDVNHGNRVTSVQPESAAAKVGIKAKDVLLRIDGMPIASVMDVQYALHKASRRGDLAIEWRDGVRTLSRSIALALDWRRTDVSWRWSLKSMSPNPSIVGDDLDVDGRAKLGLAAGQLAYRHMNFLSPAARHAGLRTGDVIIGIDGIDDRKLMMTARQFEAHIRLNYSVGQEITLHVWRGKEPIKLTMKLPE